MGAVTQAKPPTRTERLLVPDVLRGVAIIAMLIAHTMAFWPGTPAPLVFVTANINDLASPLFALVMGISAQIVWNRSPNWWPTLGQQWLRGLALILLGMWMATWGSWVAVVLAFLGVLLIVGMPLLKLPTVWLAFATIAAVIISAPLNAWARANSMEAYAWPWLIQELASWVALSPTYRFTNLLPFFLLGALLMRHGPRRDRWLWWMLAAAPVAYLVRPVGERLFDWPYVSGSYQDTLHDLGLVLLTYVAVVWLATVEPAGPRRVIHAVFVPIRACGQIALSLYLLHVAIIAAWNTAFGRPIDNQPLGWLITVPLVILIGWAWWRYVGTGPVEWLLGWATGRPKRFRVSRDAVSPSDANSRADATK